MIVCICKRVNAAQIRDAMARGVVDLPGVSRELGLGTGCGRCIEFAERMITQELRLDSRDSEVA